MNQYVKTDASGYVKDKTTNAVINNNTGDLERHKLLRAQSKERRKMQEEIIALRKELEELRLLVLKALNG
jgi:hypothetical protein